MNCFVVISKWVIEEFGSQNMNVPEVASLTDRCKDITGIDSDLVPPVPNINFFHVTCNHDEKYGLIATDDRFFVICQDGEQDNSVKAGFIESLTSYLVTQGISQDVLDSIFFSFVSPTYQEVIDELVNRIKTPGSFSPA